MSDGTDKKEEFDSTGEAIGYISLDQAILQARRLARQDEARYRDRLGWDEIAWVESSAEQREDSYRIVLQFKSPAPGSRADQMGEEEFIFGLTGDLEERQVLLWPANSKAGTGAAPAFPPDSEAPTEEPFGMGDPGFHGPMSMWPPPPIRMLLMFVSMLRKIVESAFGRESKRPDREP